MVQRPAYLHAVKALVDSSPVVAILGPRQSGKTTVARMLASEMSAQYFDLENPVDLAKLASPFVTFESLSGLIIIDEIQRKPELFEILRVLVDREKNPARFLVLGSASPRLVKGVSESLAGRIAFVDLAGFDLQEVGAQSFRQLWARGGFPRSFLAADDPVSFQWRNDFIRSFLERDIPQLGINIPAETLRRFWTMIAHYHGQVWNAAEFARSLGSSEATARNYLDILSGAYMVRQLQPWFENLKKRQVKSPKVYVRDSGILHALLTLDSLDAVMGHPKLGASWEGFALEQVVTYSASRDVYFWATHSGAELDLLIFKGGKRLGFEVKFEDAPRTTKSMRNAIEDLGLHELYVVYPGQETFLMDQHVTALSIKDAAIPFTPRNPSPS